MSPQVIYKIESMLYNIAGTIRAVLFKLDPKDGYFLCPQGRVE